MKAVKSDTYLGDIISSDGKNTENIRNRVSKGIGIVTQIFNIMEAANFGEHYFEIALLLRDSMLINGILTNADVWYNLLKSEVKELEDVDKLLLRKLLNVPETTPEEAFFLELGILPIGIIIKARRVNYLHYLLTRDTSEMIAKFFYTQWNEPTRGDWCEQVKEDLADLDIPISFEFIKSKSKDSFKNLVKNKVKEYALTVLTKKQESHSKMEPLHYTELKMQKYLKYEGVSVNQKRGLFKWRTRMEQFGENFRAGQDPIPCPLCRNHLDNQALSIQCAVIRKEMNPSKNIDDIFKDDICMETIETVTKITKCRKNLIEG